VAAGCDGKLHVIHAESGKEVAGVDIGGPTGSTPAALSGRAFFGTEQGAFFAIDVPANGIDAAEAWTHQDAHRRQAIRSAAAVSENLVVYGTQGKMVYALHPKDGQPQWSLAVDSRVESSPVIAGDYIVIATARGRVRLLSADKGEAVWEYDAGGSFIGSPIVLDRRLIIGNTDGTLYAFE
jgi:outer membrane protein assembly factor BamB